MKIAITGSNGFIAKNLIYNLILNKNFKVFKINRNTKKKELNKILTNSEIIFHFAGLNKETTNFKFQNDNINLTKYICNFLKKKKLKKKIIFSSSIQANLNNNYGKSKKKCEDILKNFTKKNNSSLIILRLPNIFGKWSKPNYNSAVSTFCYNISRGKKNTVINPNKIINLLYIDDLIFTLIKFLNKKKEKIKVVYKFKNIKKISVKKLLELISKFESSRNSFYIKKFSSNFEKKLYSTYVHFIPLKKIKYDLISHKDKRGSFMEFVKTENNGQFSIFKAKNNQIRGHHFHHSKVEKFLVINGKAKFFMKDVSSNKKIEFLLDHREPQVVETIPGWQHYIKNIGKEELSVLLWSNEVYNANKPDTYRI